MRAALVRALIPVDAQPAQAVVDGGLGCGGVAGGIGVLDAEDECAAVVRGRRAS